MADNFKQNIHLILASASPVRKKMLAAMKLDFEVIKPDFDEEAAQKTIGHLTIRDQAIYLAKHKALSISVKFPKSLVIGSDQICQLNKKALWKSTTPDQAISQLKKLSAKSHYQNNATVLYQGNKALLTHFERAKLKMRKLNAEEIIAYVNTDQSWNCAGSYKIESLGKHLFAEIKGNQDCILGLALQPLLNFLHSNNFISLI
jgi:septum formation protein